MGARGLEETRRAGRARPGHPRSCNQGNLFLSRFRSQSCCSSGGCRPHPSPPVEVGASWPSSTCPAFLSVTTLSFFREGPPYLGASWLHWHQGGQSPSQVEAFLSWTHQAESLINQNTAHLLIKTNPRCTCIQNAACSCHDMGLSSPSLQAVSTPAKMSQTQFLLLEIGIKIRNPPTHLPLILQRAEKQTWRRCPRPHLEL